MKTEYMREFIELAQSKNYSRTAEKLFISQPALSKHIVLIEEEIGADLLNRVSYGVELTEMGVYVLAEFKRIIAIYDAVKKRAEEVVTGIRGELHIGMPYYEANKFIAPILTLFKESYPNISIKTTSGQPDQIFNALVNGIIDIGFNFFNSSIMTLNYDYINILPIFSEKMVVLCAPDNSISSRETIKTSELTGQKLVRSQNGPLMEDYNDSIIGYLKNKNVKIEAEVILDNIDLLSSVILDTGAIALCDRIVVVEWN